ncbi:MAG: hypothetical protein HKN72_10000 [Gemmatimonadetes bacterium]|nr:hypothetical protein [Gemmatimonadota bacterium]NNL29385.1 hypothetical protein [Gemmatimonadota bacterium]
MNDAIHNHLSAVQMQALLDGELPRQARSKAEEHLAACPRCAGELDSWRAVFSDLAELPAHRPHEGFVQRVMSDVKVPEARPLGARLRDGIAAAFSAHGNSHVPGEVLQDFLEGSLAARRAERIEAHLGRCSACTTEADAWLGVMRRLDALEAFEPGEGFAERVLTALEVPDRLPLAARIRQTLDALLGSPAPDHVPAGVLQDFIDGALPLAASARVEAHVGGCGRCASELHSWEGVAVRLEALHRFEPSPDFGERVMVGLRTTEVAAREPAWSRLAHAARGRVRRFVPETRQAVAALSGAAVTPMVVIGLAAWAVLSHPAVTVGSLASFAWWQLTDLATAALSGAVTLATQSADVFGLLSVLESLASAPALVAGGAVAYTMICALALRVLYKNLLAQRSQGGRHPHVSTAS